MYTILSLDGGGLRSAFTARILSRLLEKYPLLIKNTKMLAGNSGGAIVASALAIGYPPTEIEKIFALEGGRIFDDNFGDDLLDAFGLSGAQYGEKRRDVFKSYYGDNKISDTDHDLLLTAFDLKHRSGRWKPVSFHNFDGSRHADKHLVDAVMASSAAPTFFPVAQLPESKYSDGGTWANNPSLAAFSEAVNNNSGRQPYDQIVVLNIGTIACNKTLKTAKRDLGVIDWFKNGFIDMLLDSAAMDSVSYYCQNILGPRYHRVNLLVDYEIPMDDPDKIPEILDLADSIDLTDTINWLQGFWYKPTTLKRQKETEHEI